MNPDNKNLTNESLQGNEKIETAIAALQQEATEEMLAHVLTIIRRSMKENKQLIIAVEPPKGDGKINLQTIRTNDGKQWLAAFTSFDEELKGSDKIMSTLLPKLTRFFSLHYRNHLLKVLLSIHGTAPSC